MLAETGLGTSHRPCTAIAGWDKDRRMLSPVPPRQRISYSNKLWNVCYWLVSWLVDFVCSSAGRKDAFKEGGQSKHHSSFQKAWLVHWRIESSAVGSITNVNVADPVKSSEAVPPSHSGERKDWTEAPAPSDGLLSNLERRAIFDLSYCWRIGLLVPDSMWMYLYEPNLSLHSSWIVPA